VPWEPLRRRPPARCYPGHIPLRAHCALAVCPALGLAASRVRGMPRTLTGCPCVACDARLQRTIGDEHPEAEARDEGNGARSQGTAPAGRSSMRSSVASGPTDSLRTVARDPSITSRRQLPKSSKRQLISLYFQLLATAPHGRDPGWHGARTVGHRAAAQTSIQLNILTLFGELK